MNIGTPQAIRTFDLSPCSELRFDLRCPPPHRGAPLLATLPVLTVRIDPRGNVPVAADWFGFATSTATTGSASETLTLRVGCAYEAASTALFTSSGCYVTVEGPASVVQKCLPLCYFDLDTSARSFASGGGGGGVGAGGGAGAVVGGKPTAVVGTIDNAWPHWRRQLLGLHDFFHSQRMAAYERGKARSDDDINSRIGPRVLVCSSRAGCGKTTVCRSLLNLAVRDGFQPLFVAADSSGTSLVGQPGCFAAFYADHGVDPTEAGAHYPTVQVALPIEDCERSKRAEPWRYSINALMDLAEQRTLNVASCASGGFIVDTDCVDEFLSEDDLNRITAVIDECDIRYVVVVGSENLRNTLRCRLQPPVLSGLLAGNAHHQQFSGLDADGGAPTAEQLQHQHHLVQQAIIAPGCGAGDAVLVRRKDTTVTLLNFPVVDGADDGGMRAAAAAVSSATSVGSSAIQARWHRYFFGTPTSPLSSWTHRVPVAESKWCYLRSQTSSYGGILPLLGAGEEQQSVFRAVAQPVDIASRFAAYVLNQQQQQQQQQGGGGNKRKPLVAAVMRASDVTDAVCSADILGFVAVASVVDGIVEMMSPCRALPRVKHVFAIIYSAYQP